MTIITENIWLKSINKQRNSKESIIKEEISSIEYKIINSSILVKLIKFIYKYIYVHVAIILILFFMKIIRGPTTLIALISLLVIKKLNLQKKAENRALHRAKRSTGKLQKRLSELNDELNNISKWYYDELDKRCIDWSTYPPDWSIRKYKVLKRDGHCCQKCGWPKGFKRRRRELHIHHIIPVAKGGTHNIENLITLCNICHSKVDFTHAWVRKVKGKRYG